ncbi:MAG: hypothetical protein IJV77_03265 [Clostridia bacterium]|nr:hypothetical protein [Clostridia bacterium]
MAKSDFEKAIEKTMRQDKQLAAKKKKDEDRKAREKAAEARKVAMREKAMTIVNGQTKIGGMLIMDEAAEEILNILLSVYQANDERLVRGNFDIIPVSYHSSLSLEFEKLSLYGVIASPCVWEKAMWEAAIMPQGFSYFSNKEKALKRQEEEQKQMSVENIINYGNMVFGNVSNSTLSVDNSIHEVERMVDKLGGDDKKELLEILEEVKELLENIRTSRTIPKQKKLFQRIGDHFAKHEWFYGTIVQLLGTVTMTMLGA